MIVLDMNVLSEVMKPKPSAQVRAAIHHHHYSG
jgi:predicted nucleic acid-binding protein